MEALFYVKTKLGNILVDHYDIDLPNFNGFQSDVKEIIERVPSYEEFTSMCNENEKLKKQNKRLREIIEVCQRYFDNQRVTDAWADNIKMDIDDTMGDLGMDELK